MLVLGILKRYGMIFYDLLTELFVTIHQCGRDETGCLYMTTIGELVPSYPKWVDQLFIGQFSNVQWL